MPVRLATITSIFFLGHEYYDYRYYMNLGPASRRCSLKAIRNWMVPLSILDKVLLPIKSVVNNEGFFGRLQYNYDERIFGSASLRRDASAVSIRTIAGVHSGR